MKKVKTKKRIYNNKYNWCVNKKGFSLIELVVAIFISSVIIITVVAAFASAFNAQKNVRNAQKDIESAKASLEMMAKIIRMGSNPVVTNSNKTIYMFNSSLGECIQFNINGLTSIKEKYCKSCNSSDPCHEGSFLATDQATCDDPNQPSANKHDCVTNTILTTPIPITQALTGALFSIPAYPASTMPKPIKRVTIEMQMVSNPDAVLETTISLRDYKNLNPTSQ